MIEDFLSHRGTNIGIYLFVSSFLEERLTIFTYLQIPYFQGNYGELFVFFGVFNVKFGNVEMDTKSFELYSNLG